MDDKTMESEIWATMQRLHQQLQAGKPSERNELARRYAVTITEFEKVMGYYNTFVIEGLSQGQPDATT